MNTYSRIVPLSLLRFLSLLLSFIVSSLLFSLPSPSDRQPISGFSLLFAFCFVFVFFFVRSNHRLCFHKFPAGARYVSFTLRAARAHTHIHTYRWRNSILPAPTLDVHQASLTVGLATCLVARSVGSSIRNKHTHRPIRLSREDWLGAL